MICPSFLVALASIFFVASRASVVVKNSTDFKITSLGEVLHRNHHGIDTLGTGYGYMDVQSNNAINFAFTFNAVLKGGEAICSPSFATTTQLGNPFCIPWYSGCQLANHAFNFNFRTVYGNAQHTDLVFGSFGYPWQCFAGNSNALPGACANYLVRYDTYNNGGSNPAGCNNYYGNILSTSVYGFSQFCIYNNNLGSDYTEFSGEAYLQGVSTSTAFANPRKQYCANANIAGPAPNTQEVLYTPANLPTAAPNTPSAIPTIPPTAIPSLSPTHRPTASPTMSPTFATNEIAELTCTPYTAANTANATVNYATCRFIACHGYVVDISMCAADTYGYASCTNDPYLAVYDSHNQLITANDNRCGKCPGLSFIVNTVGGCAPFTIRQGCQGNTACGGTVAVTLSNLIPTIAPTAMPTITPTHAPTAIPTTFPYEDLTFALDITLGHVATEANTPSDQALIIQALAQVLHLSPSAFVFHHSQASSAPSPVGTTLFDVAMTFDLTVPIFQYPQYQGDWHQLLADLQQQLTQAIADGSFLNILQQLAATQGQPGQTEAFATGTVVPGTASLSNAVNVPHYTASPTAIPTATPSVAPTFNAREVNSFYCEPYTASNTHNNTMGYQSCTFLACNSYDIVASMCPLDTFGMAECSGDTLLTVYDQAGALVSTNNNYCGACAAVSFKASPHCQKYTIHEGCFGDSACGGTVAVTTFFPPEMEI